MCVYLCVWGGGVCRTRAVLPSPSCLFCSRFLACHVPFTHIGGGRIQAVLPAASWVGGRQGQGRQRSVHVSCAVGIVAVHGLINMYPVCNYICRTTNFQIKRCFNCCRCLHVTDHTRMYTQTHTHKFGCMRYPPHPKKVLPVFGVY